MESLSKILKSLFATRFQRTVELTCENLFVTSKSSSNNCRVTISYTSLLLDLLVTKKLQGTVELTCKILYFTDDYSSFVELTCEKTRKSMCENKEIYVWKLALYAFIRVTWRSICIHTRKTRKSMCENYKEIYVWEKQPRKTRKSMCENFRT